jgi:glycogen operon protein
MPALAASASRVNGLGALLTIIRQDPALSQVKLLADGWGTGSDGYGVGSFPPLWAEQNRGFRDWARNLWRPGIIPFWTSHLCMTGSPDWYDPLGPLDRPASPVNYVTSHDGFTMADLVAYNDKHNDANGQGNQDGPDDERSWNSGTEGPTDDRSINQLRAQRIRGLLATLFLAQGTPLLLAGDELGRTQAGNNHAWCQDNALTWLDWEQADHGLIGYVAALSKLRQAHPLLVHGATRSALWAPALTVPDSACLDQHGKPVTEASAAASAFQLFLNGRPMTADQWDAGEPVDNDLLILVNAGGDGDEFTLPSGEYAMSWEIALDTSDATGKAGLTLRPAQSLIMEANSVAVLIGQRE